MKPIIYPYKKGLRSTALLRDTGAAVRYDTSNVTRRRTAIAWGNRNVPSWANNVDWVNHPAAIPVVADKLNWGKLCSGSVASVCSTDFAHSTPDFLFSLDEAEEASEAGLKVLCRTVLNGNSGEGIVVARRPDQLVEAPLYSVYVPKQREYRVVYGSQCGVIHLASKRRRPDTDLPPNGNLIRTMNNGWVYQLETEAPEPVLRAVRAVSYELANLGLNLLAYDVGFNTEIGKAVVYECNTAWGLNGASAENTLAAIRNWDFAQGGQL